MRDNASWSRQLEAKRLIPSLPEFAHSFEAAHSTLLKNIGVATKERPRGAFFSLSDFCRNLPCLYFQYEGGCSPSRVGASKVFYLPRKWLAAFEATSRPIVAEGEAYFPPNAEGCLLFIGAGLLLVVRKTDMSRNVRICRIVSVFALVKRDGTLGRTVRSD